MPFHFPLEAVFHFRKSIEHQQELRLRAANQQLAGVRHLLDQIDNRMRQAQDRDASALQNGTTGAEMRLAIAGQVSLHRQRQDLERELLRFENLREQQQRIFRQSRREREIFESLRDQQLDEYKREAARREQRQLDDLHLLRRSYVRHRDG